MILITKTPLGTIEDFIDAYPTGTDAANEATVKIWEQKAKGKRTMRGIPCSKERTTRYDDGDPWSMR